MRLLILCFVLLAPAIARADQYPYISRGPIISGVTQTDAWVTWGTTHHQGNGFTCSTDALTGSPNTDIPTLHLTPSGTNGDIFKDSNCAREHRVHLTGLTPGTRYTFTLDKPWEGGSVMPIGAFVTAPPMKGGTFSFVVYGDNRDAPALQASTEADHKAVADGILQNEPGAAFLVHTGDLALNLPAVSGDDRGYSEFFDVERGLLSSRGIFTAIGNHETIDTTEFDTFVNAPGFAQSAHPYYWSVDWGQVHFAFLDAFEGPPTTLGLGGNDPGITAQQITWLDADLAAAHAAGQHLFIVTHQGPYSHSNDSNAHGGSPDMQAKVVPLMLKYGVLATFAGHDHYYQRGHEGCVDYLVIGGGGAPAYEPDSSAAGVVTSAKTTSYFVVNVDGPKVAGMAKSSGGGVLDSFTFQVPDGTPCDIPPIDPPDAGMPMDGGMAVDAGVEIDAGMEADAGIPASDAGPELVDAGTPAPDAGVVAMNVKPGCGCSGPDLTGLALLGLGAIALRRRR